VKLLARFRREEAPAEPAPAAEPAPSPAPESSAALVISPEEAVELIRSRRGDVFEIRFLTRELERLRASPEPGAAARAEETSERLKTVIERKLRAKGVLAPDGRLELV
jgi:hypothetical protein